MTNILSIAGFDPSGGAGVLADIKTFEQHGIQGFGTCTAITFQNDSTFEGVKWLSIEDIVSQIEILKKRFKINYIKIGLIENLKTLTEIVNFLNSDISKPFIIWDPILKASAGFQFHNQFENETLIKVLTSISLITPNIMEYEFIKSVCGVSDDKMASFCDVLLKGGHSTDSNSNDYLFENNKKHELKGKRSSYQKHGTGCVLSAAICSNLALGNSLHESCKNAKKYTFNYIKSSPNLLGFHTFKSSDFNPPSSLQLNMKKKVRLSLSKSESKNS